MKNTVNTVILNDKGSFLRSCSFYNNGCEPRWAIEYPDATLFTSNEAKTVARKMQDHGYFVTVVRDYGLATEAKLTY